MLISLGKFKLYKLPIRLNNSGHSSLESIIAVKTCSTTDIDLLKKFLLM